MSDTILGYLVSLGVIFAGIVWIGVAGTIWTACATDQRSCRTTAPDRFSYC